MPKLINEIKAAVAAAFSGIWINSYEHEDAMAAIAAACKDQSWELITWDPEYGLRKSADAAVAPSAEEPNPIMAIHELRKIDAEETRAVLVLRNFTPYLSTREGVVGSPVALQCLQNTIERGATDGHHVIILS